MVNNQRRDFLKVSGTTAALVAGQGYLFAKTGVTKVENGKENYPNTTYTESMYRNEFGFTYGKKEEHGYAYHCVNCQGNCAWEIWSHNGVVTRENQSANYPVINAKVPDFNPRGCNKGVQHSQVMYEKDRILYPMKRAGERGEGKWKRISWDEAATEVAQKIWDTMTDPERGPSKLLVQAGTGLLTEGRRGAPLRFGTQLGASRIYPSSYLGDMFSGAALAYGEGNLGCTWDFMFNVDVAVNWGANPSVSRIPDAHFVWEGKYNGAEVITITPEFNATARQSDLWIPIKPGTDNILAMSVISVILEEKLYKPGFIKTFTDLPFLVNKKTKKMIRRTEMEAGQEHNHEAEEEFYCMNAETGMPALMPGSEGSKEKTLRISDFGISPDLEFEGSIKLANGESVEVTTAFNLLVENAKLFTPEATKDQTGVNPETARILARKIAIPKVVQITTGFSLNKYYTGILTMWNISSIAGLTGRMGPYGSVNTENEFSLSGLGALSGFSGKYNPRFGSGFVGEFVMGNGMETVDDYFSDEDIRRANSNKATGRSIGKEEYMKTVEAILADAAEKRVNGETVQGAGHRYYEPDTAIIIADSRFRRNKGSKYRDAFLKKMKYFAYVDYRMSETAIYADLVLPAKSHYEVYDLRSSPGYHRFTNLAQPAKDLKAVGESMDEWSMFALIAKKLEEIANKDENIDKAQVPDEKKYAREGFHDLSIFYQEFTNTDEESETEGEPYLGTDKLALDAALLKCDQYQPWTIEKMYKAGGFLQLNEKAAKSSPLYSDKPFNSNEDHVFKFAPLETMSGRQTFYVDHDRWIDLGSNTNTAMQPITPISVEHPFTMMTPHARWSIHSNYKTSRTLQRLQRGGVPYVMINQSVADAKGIKDGDDIKIYNKLGSFIAMAKVSNQVSADSLVMEHGWEPHQYKGMRGHNEVVPTALNLLELTSGWGHMKFGGLWDGNQYAYDGAVNVEKA